MTYYNHRLTCLMTLRDACQSAPGSLGHIGEPFSAGYLEFRGRGSPTHEKFGILLLDLAKSQPFQFTVVELTYIILDHHLKVVRPAHQLGGLTRPLKTARINSMNGFVAELGCDLLSLAEAYFGKPAITRTLAAALKVPIRCPMAKQNDLHQHRSAIRFLQEARD